MQAGDAVPEDPDLTPPPIVPELPRPLNPPRGVDPEMAALLDALAGRDTAPARPDAARGRLFERIAHSAEAAKAMFTMRRKDAALSRPAPGVRVSLLYQARPQPLRRGEPLAVRWIELAAGARWHGDWPANDLQRDWLVIRGHVNIGGKALDALDYHVVPAGLGVADVATDTGATLYLREAPPSLPSLHTPLATAVQTAAYAQGEWADFAPGIRRRVLWARGAEAAMLYHALPGAAVPQHAHGHDEECLMLEGELFLDDVLLRAGEYQLAPAGTRHGGVSTDTGVVIYAHGDLDLELTEG